MGFYDITLLYVGEIEGYQGSLLIHFIFVKRMEYCDISSGHSFVGGRPVINLSIVRESFNEVFGKLYIRQ